MAKECLRSWNQPARSVRSVRRRLQRRQAPLSQRGQQAQLGPPNPAGLRLLCRLWAPQPPRLPWGRSGRLHRSRPERQSPPSPLLAQCPLPGRRHQRHPRDLLVQLDQQAPLSLLHPPIRRGLPVPRAPELRLDRSRRPRRTSRPVPLGRRGPRPPSTQLGRWVPSGRRASWQRWPSVTAARPRRRPRGDRRGARPLPPPPPPTPLEGRWVDRFGEPRSADVATDAVAPTSRRWRCFALL